MLKRNTIKSYSEVVKSKTNTAASSSSLDSLVNGGVDLKGLSVATAAGSSAIELQTTGIDPDAFKDGISFKITSMAQMQETALAAWVE